MGSELGSYILAQVVRLWNIRVNYRGGKLYIRRCRVAYSVVATRLHVER